MSNPLIRDAAHLKLLRREQRRIARACHPDLGADAGADQQRFTRLMQELETRNAGKPGSEPQPVRSEGAPVFVVRRNQRTAAWRRCIRASRHTLRAARAQLPRRMPGAQRYIDL